MIATEQQHIEKLCQLMRMWILESTHAAGSGHPTSAMSAVELMAGLFFTGQLKYEPSIPRLSNNDRVIFSKGHATPLLYALWAAAGQISEDDLLAYRKFESPLEGHPTQRFKFAEAATGSLGQGLSIGVGMALSAKLDGLPFRTYVLLGDSEMSEGSQWEAIQIASHYKLDNLVGILDVNRLGQRGPTQFGHDLDAYRRRLEAFGWDVVTVDDGHDLAEIRQAYASIAEPGYGDRPTMIVARTIKGRGVSFLEDKDGWHGKALDDEELDNARKEIGDVDRTIRGEIAAPELLEPILPDRRPADEISYKLGDELATRDGYGEALLRLAPELPQLVVLDGEVSNSTRAGKFRKSHPSRFLEMFIAEQNMAGTALGFALRGKTPFISTFAAFLTRAFDQIRMAVHSGATIHFIGSHAGISIGQDGPSQMGLEDLAMFRTVPGATVLYPCDAVSTERLVEEMVEQSGVCYLRTSRGKTPVIYDNSEKFPVGGCKVFGESEANVGTIVAAGVTLHEALTAQKILHDHDVSVRVIDLYSVKPLDAQTLHGAAKETDFVVTVEDHYPEGGIGEAVVAELADQPVPVFRMAVDKRPQSGSPERLREHEGISAQAIANACMRLQPTLS